jgi:hypothetical protein
MITNTELLARIATISELVARGGAARANADRFSVGSVYRERAEQRASAIDDEICALCNDLKRDIRQG